jgi:hypothetical protein
LKLDGTNIKGIKMDDQNLEDVLREDVQKQINFQIHKCFHKFGIGGTEDKINEVYLHMPYLKELWLTEYWKILRGK